MKAIAYVFNPDTGKHYGFVEFIQNKSYTTIKIDLYNLPPGQHGFHIHEYGDLSQGCKSTGSHYNPFHKPHGGRFAKNRHVGDLGNIVVKANGKAKATMRDHLIRLTGKYSVIGRTIVVHAEPDDLGKGGFDDSATSGHSGHRIACGVIGIKN